MTTVTVYSKQGGSKGGGATDQVPLNTPTFYYNSPVSAISSNTNGYRSIDLQANQVAYAVSITGVQSAPIVGPVSGASLIINNQPTGYLYVTTTPSTNSLPPYIVLYGQQNQAGAPRYSTTFPSNFLASTAFNGFFSSSGFRSIYIQPTSSIVATAFNSYTPPGGTQINSTSNLILYGNPATIVNAYPSISSVPVVATATSPTGPVGGSGPAPSNTVIVYKNTLNDTGNNVKSLPAPNTYTADQLQGLGFKDNISAMKIASGLNVVLYQGDSSGASSTIVGPTIIPSLTSSTFQTDSSVKMNDNIASMAITGFSPVPTIGKSVTGTVIQRTQPLTYTIGATNPGQCNPVTPVASQCYGNDWAFGTSKNGNCPDLRLCSILDATACPKIGPGVNSTAWATSANTNSQGALVNCTYDLGNFNTAADVNAWLNNQNWASSDAYLSTYDQQIMPFFCGQQIAGSDAQVYCPIDPKTGKPMTSCSRFVMTSSDGAACQAWITQGYTGNPFSSASADATMIQYCGQYPNSPDCACINRSQNSVFNALNGTGSSLGNPHCWYTPCIDSKVALIPSSIVNYTCTLNVCQQIENIINNKNSNISVGQAQNTINCNFSNTNGGTGSSTTSTTSTPTTPNTSNTSNTTTPTSSTGPTKIFGLDWYWWVVIVVVIIIILLAAGGVIFFVVR